MNLEDLEFEITSLAAHINAATARWLELIAEFDEREGYVRWECRNTAHWLNWRCGIDMGAASEKVRTARALGSLQTIKSEFAKGRLSYSKVRALTRVATPENENELCELALISTASQLELIVRSIRKFGSVGEESAEPKEIEQYCHWQDQYDGTVKIEAQLGADEAAVVIAALSKSGDALREQNLSAENENARRVNQADALVAMAESSLRTETESCDERYQVVLHIDSESAHTDSGFAFSAENAQRLSCDAPVIAQVENAEGEILSVGRKTRAIPTAIRRAMRNRDRTCRFPGCDATRFVDRHHIKHWSKGGETKLSNLVTLCRRHHRLCHDQHIAISPSGEAFRFETRDGTRIDRMYCQRGSASAVDNNSLPVSAEMLAGTGESLTRYALNDIIQYFG